MFYIKYIEKRGVLWYNKLMYKIMIFAEKEGSPIVGSCQRQKEAAHGKI